MEDNVNDESEAIRAVAEEYGVTAPQIMGRSRKSRIAEARHVAMLLLRTDSGLSTVRIGKLLQRDHSTVVVGIRNVKDLASVDNATRLRIEAVRGRLHRQRVREMLRKAAMFTENHQLIKTN